MQVNIRLTKEENDKVQTYAEASGLSLANWIRQGGILDDGTGQQAKQQRGKHGADLTANLAGRRTTLSANQSGGHKVDSSHLSDSHLIVNLLGVDHDALHVDMAAINQLNSGKRENERQIL